ncbi:MAG TPA: HAMP domain-containing histidine kinase [Candidatus Blautia intestinigallinarum]|nr:HAMP domain-containing histidine kinase [Candidatus Blautia intestinigallinarum]
MRSLIKIYLKYIGGIIGLVFFFLIVEMIVTSGIIQKVYDEGSSRYESNIREMGEKVATNGKNQVENPRELEEMARQAGLSFAMILNENGEVIWDYQLPSHLNHDYTVAEVSVLSKWYLDEYPIMTWKQGDDLLVAAYPRDSIWRYNFWQDQGAIHGIFHLITFSFFTFLGLTFLVIILMGYRSYRKVKVFTRAIENLAAGKEVLLSEKGSMGEVARSINQTSDRLKKQMEMLNQRDEARTQWISGVSHDIRTPLSLVLGYSNLLEEKAETDEQIRAEAALIRRESIKIRDLIEDLNLTSKLEYHMQPLRMTQVQPAKILRQVIADILNSVAMDEEKYPFQVVISGEFEKLQTEMDERLMKRVFQNVIGNAVRHNEEGCGIQVEAKCAKDQMVITVTDTGVGIPREICDYINDGGEEPSCHVMGLRIVKQIVNAHQGEIRIEEGHRIYICIPVQNKD